APVFAGVTEDPAAAWGTADEVSVFGDGVVVVLRSHPATSTAARASAKVHSFIVVSVSSPGSCKRRTMRARGSPAPHHRRRQLSAAQLADRSRKTGLQGAARARARDLAHRAR